MKTLLFLIAAVFHFGCNSSDQEATVQVRRADPQIRRVARGEPRLERHFDILSDPAAFDKFCETEAAGGRVWLAQCEDGLLRRCVSNSKAQWVLIPGTPGLNFWTNHFGGLQILGADIYDLSLPPKPTAFYEPGDRAKQNKNEN